MRHMPKAIVCSSQYRLIWSKKTRQTAQFAFWTELGKALDTAQRPYLEKATPVRSSHNGYDFVVGTVQKDMVPCKLPIRDETAGSLRAAPYLANEVTVYIQTPWQRDALLGVAERFKTLQIDAGNEKVAATLRLPDKAGWARQVNLDGGKIAAELE